MRFFLGIILLLFSFSAFAAQKSSPPLIISDSVTVTSAVKPDMLTSGMSVGFKGYDTIQTTAAMEKIVSIIKARSGICTFAGYQISPVYKYVDNVQIRDGYSGYLDFSCNFKSIADYEPVINDIFNLTSGEPAYSVTSRPVRWTVSEAVSAAKNAELKSKAIKQIFTASKNYAKTINTFCKVKDINMDYEDFAPFKESGAKTARNISEPDKTDFTVKLTAKYKLACR